jgi:putative transposase
MEVHMARPLRLDYPGAWHHVMNRGWNKVAVFESPGDHGKFIDILRQTCEQFRLQVAAFCLMPNHFHLLVRTPEGNLPRCMRHLSSVYTQYFNRKHQSDGPLFKGRYRSILVEEETYLHQLVRYIHQNPVRAGLAARLEEYPWSSHQGYLSESSEWAWLSKSLVLGRFANRQEYLAFVRQDDSDVGEVFSLKRLPAMLGSDRFVGPADAKVVHLDRVCLTR